MSGKKTEMIAFRLSEERKKEAEKICEGYGHTPGSMAGLLFEKFLQHSTENGKRLIWPPEFNYYPVGSKSIQDKENKKSEIANGSSKKKAG